MSANQGTEGAPAGSPSSTAGLPLKRPVDEQTAYDNLCGICFTEIDAMDNPRGRLNSCEHLFCSYCIKEWAKNTNVCPSCKSRFTRIFTVAPGTDREEITKVRRKNYVAWEESYYADDSSGDDNADVSDDDELRDLLPDSLSTETASREDTDAVHCGICNQSQNAARMIFCDRRECGFAAHLDCLGFSERPLTFLCSQCTELRRSSGHAPPQAALSSTEPPTAVMSSAAVPADLTAGSPRRAGSLRSAPTPPLPRKIPVTRPPANWFEMLSTGRLRLDDDRDPTVHDHDHEEQPRRASRPVQGMREHEQSSVSSSRGGRQTSGASAAQPERAALVAVDFSKVHLPGDRSSPVAPQRSTHTPVSEQDEDELYFLKATNHTRSAMAGLQQLKEARAHESQLRQRRESFKRRRIEESLLHQPEYGLNRHRGGAGSRLPTALAEGHLDSTTPTLLSPMERRKKDLEEAEADLLNPQLRSQVEDRMARDWAADLVPVLRRNQATQQSRLRLDATGAPIYDAPLSSEEVALRDRKLWETAQAQARTLVKQTLDAKAANLRARREAIVAAQAQREAAALAKLARIIAAHRSPAPR